MFVRNGQFMTSFCSAAGQYFTAIGILHAPAKSVYRLSATRMGLVGSFFSGHFIYFFPFTKIVNVRFCQPGTIPAACERTAKVGVSV
jgi:hypothetical protein